MFTMKSLQ